LLAGKDSCAEDDTFRLRLGITLVSGRPFSHDGAKKNLQRPGSVCAPLKL
jgi:hypothetical protein